MHNYLFKYIFLQLKCKYFIFYLFFYKYLCIFINCADFFCDFLFKIYNFCLKFSIISLPSYKLQ